VIERDTVVHRYVIVDGLIVRMDIGAC